jgi:prepilin-type N-terminal cleavage/methylation domain-containing protein
MIGRRRRQRGFTLVEAIIAIAISSLIMVALGGSFAVGYRIISTEASTIYADTAVSQSTVNLLRDLASATTVAPVPGTLTAGAGTVTVTYGSPAVTAIYTIDATGTLLRASGGRTTAAARGLRSLVFSQGAAACLLVVSISPSAAGAPTQTLDVALRPGATGCF